MNLIRILEHATSWQDIYINLIAHNQDNLCKAGKTFEQIAKLYFLCEPSVRDEYKHIWLFNEAPLNVKQKLGLGHKDNGIDLILEDHEDRLAVVQCKFKQDQSSTVSWSKDKLANMLAEGIRLISLSSLQIRHELIPTPFLRNKTGLESLPLVI